jgi:chemosensory pili system protein ChpB (putative protein-glutamate methylesterase)
MKPVDVDAATRVALLARPGVACERLQAALQEAGADIVLVADPSQSDVAGVRAAGAEAILIALEPLVDDALDRYDALLADPAITVIFDEAVLAAEREGWDAARWTRHLAAKLNRHEQVLPPGADSDQDANAPVASIEPHVPLDLEIDIPMPGDGDVAASQDEVAVDGDAHGLELPVDLGGGGDGDLAAFLDAITIGAPATSTASAEASLADIDLDSVDIAQAAPAANAADETFLSFDPTLAEYDMVADVGATTSTPMEFETPSLDDEPHAPMLDEADAASDKGDNSTVKERFRLDLDALELRIADMQLEDVRPPRAASNDGAVLVMAGIGGPDAVRQLLAGLPVTFPRAVLIQQRLEGARHDNLVRQMQRATAMPVRLAQPGAILERGHVYVLPTGMGVVAQPDGLHFDGDGEELIARLPSADSAVILLSGAELSHVDAALSLGLRGSLVAGQSPDGCFDAAASEALVARGGTSATPADIAKQLATRWPS